MKTTGLTAFAGVIFVTLATFDLEAGTYDTRVPNPRFSDWADSNDGIMSISLTTDKTTYLTNETIVVRCAIRNNTTNSLLIVKPFYQPVVAHEQLYVTGPTGQVSYSGPEVSFAWRSEYLQTVAAGTIMDWTLELDRRYLGQLGVPGLYRIAYSFRSHAPNAPEGFWKGDVIAPAVCVLVKEQTP